MSFRLYLLPNPRRLVLVSDTTALVFRRAGDPDAKAEIELVSNEDVDLASMVRVNRGRSVLGVLGLLSIPVGECIVPVLDLSLITSCVGATNEIFLLISAAAISLPPLLPGTSLTSSKLLNVEFHCLSSQLWDDPSIVPALPAIDTGVFDDMDLDRDQSAYLASQPPLGHPCDGMKRILEAGTFYYATHGNWDISRALFSWDWRALRDGQQADPAAVLDSYDERFGTCLFMKNVKSKLIASCHQSGTAIFSLRYYTFVHTFRQHGERIWTICTYSFRSFRCVFQL